MQSKTQMIRARFVLALFHVQALQKSTPGGEHVDIHLTGWLRTGLKNEWWATCGEGCGNSWLVAKCITPQGRPPGDGLWVKPCRCSLMFEQLPVANSMPMATTIFTIFRKNSPLFLLWPLALGAGFARRAPLRLTLNSLLVLLFGYFCFTSNSLNLKRSIEIYNPWKSLGSTDAMNPSST